MAILRLLPPHRVFHLQTTVFYTSNTVYVHLAASRLRYSRYKPGSWILLCIHKICATALLPCTSNVPLAGWPATRAAVREWVALFPNPSTAPGGFIVSQRGCDQPSRREMFPSCSSKQLCGDGWPSHSCRRLLFSSHSLLFHHITTPAFHDHFFPGAGRKGERKEAGRRGVTRIKTGPRGAGCLVNVGRGSRNHGATDDKACTINWRQDKPAHRQPSSSFFPSLFSLSAIFSLFQLGYFLFYFIFKKKN